MLFTSIPSTAQFKAAAILQQRAKNEGKNIAVKKKKEKRKICARSWLSIIYEWKTQ